MRKVAVDGPRNLSPVVNRLSSRGPCVRLNIREPSPSAEETSDARYPEIPYTPTGGGEDQRGRTSTGLGGGRKHREEAIPKSDRRQERIRLEPGGGLRGTSGWSRFGDRRAHLDGAGSGTQGDIWMEPVRGRAKLEGRHLDGAGSEGGRFGQTCSFLSGWPGECG